MTDATTAVREDIKEEITTFDIAPANGLEKLRDRAEKIDEFCSDELLKRVTLDKMAVICDGGKFITRFKSDDTGEVFSKSFSEHSFSQLCSKLGIPANYMYSCAKRGNLSLAEDNFNSWLETYNRDLFIRMYKDNVRGILSSRYSKFDTPEVIDVVSQCTRGLGLRVKGFFLNEERFHARLIQQEKMNVNGEDLFAGIQIDSSDVGRNVLSVNFFIFKQICSNGLCISKGNANLFTQRHVNICSDDFKAALKESLKCLPELIAEYAGIIESCTTSYKLVNGILRPNTDKELADAELQKLIESIRRKTRLPDDGAEKVILISQNKYDLSDWGIINGITEVAQDYTLERRIELERIAGGLLRVV